VAREQREAAMQERSASAPPVRRVAPSLLWERVAELKRLSREPNLNRTAAEIASFLLKPAVAAGVVVVHRGAGGA
jgi:hypothetical protein